jgi:hypothetical protein
MRHFGRHFGITLFLIGAYAGGCVDRPKPIKPIEGNYPEHRFLTWEEIQSSPRTVYLFEDDKLDFSGADTAQGAMAIADRWVEQNEHYPTWGKAKSAHYSQEALWRDYDPNAEKNAICWNVDYGDRHIVKLVIGFKPSTRPVVPIDPNFHPPPG